jgi:hypothetical protein
MNTKNYTSVQGLYLGSGTGHFGERDRALWGAGPGTLGSGTGHFGERELGLSVENTCLIRL